ncbi:VOC family protein [Candidatus Nanohaloarchaea archaeon]|nr:VOC family protein [Candidatus Nanohaloarchaea archaeon]
MSSSFIDHINIRIPESRVDEALGFYRDFLGLTPFMLEDYRSGDRTSFFVKLDSGQLINLRPVGDFERPSGSNLDHFCIVVDRDVDDVRSEAGEKGYEVLRESTPLGSEGRAPAVYVEDPFGYVVEIKQKK